MTLAYSHLLMTVVLVGCAAASSEVSTQAATAATSFHYDATKGYCVDANGKRGFNQMSVKDLLKLDAGQPPTRPRISNVNAECADLSKIDLDTQVNTGSGVKNYIFMPDWNLRGATLNGANFSFGTLRNADLSGAIFDKVKLGYSAIDGRVDQASKVHSSCHVTADQVTCRL